MSLSSYQKYIISLGVVSVISLFVGWQLGHTDIVIKRNSASLLPNVSFVNQQAKGLTQDDISQFWAVWDLVTTKYLERSKVTPQQLMEGAKAGLVEALDDPYSVYLTEKQNKESKEDLGGSFEGVGMQLGFNKDKILVVVAPLEGSPAEKAGIRAGDKIWVIDGKDTPGLSIPEAVELIRGEKGTTVTLKMQRENGDFYDVDVKRDTIVINSIEVKPLADTNIVHVKINRFGDTTREEWDKAVQEIIQKGYKKVILDVRNNPGGYMDTAIYINSDFLSGVVMQQEDYKGNRTPYPADHNARLSSVKVLVLINKGSASASEIVAGGLQDRGFAKLVGETSFGKGTIQEVEDLAKGTGVHITTGKWLLPSGRWVHKEGLKPDYEVKLSEDDILNKKDPQLDKAIELMR